MADDTADREPAGDHRVRLAAIPAKLQAHPAFAPYRDALAGLAPLTAAEASSEASAIEAEAITGAQPPRLIAPLARALGALEFERHIVEHNELVIRPGNLHDSVNALVWQRFPRSKRAISVAHVQLGAAATANGRPRRRDILTLFDEAGALIIGQRDDLREMHERHAWRTLFVEHRTEFMRDCRVVLFGHGTLEQLASNPHRGRTVKALWLDLPVDTPLEQVDEALAAGIGHGRLLTASERRLPLPLLGIPGWFDENRDPACYDDLDVFRPLRRQQHSA